MSSFLFEIGEREREGGRAIGDLRSELQRVRMIEKRERKLTQQKIADRLEVNRSVVNRLLMGTLNMTVRSAAELAWAMGWKLRFELFKPELTPGQNDTASGTTRRPDPIPPWVSA